MSAEARWGFKPADVEEWIDAVFHRPLAGRLARRLVPTSITPNQVTLASGLAGASAGLAIALGSPLFGAALLLLAVILDCADGQLARLRGTSSLLGRILDGLVDGVTPLAVMSALAGNLAAWVDHPWPWALGLAAGVSLGWHASLYDHVKNLYLAGAHPQVDLGGGTLRAIEELEGHRIAAEARGDRAAWVLLTVWRAWTRPQLRVLEPWLQPGVLPADDATRRAFVVSFRPIMRAVSWLGFGTHLFLLQVAVAATALWPGSALVAWVIMVLPANLLALAVEGALLRRRTAWLASSQEPPPRRDDP